MKIESLINDNIKQLSNYQAANIYEELSKLDGVIRMDLNENYVISPELVRWVLRYVADRVDPRRYPPPKGIKALKSLSILTGIDEKNLAVGSGADELIEKIVDIFIGKGRAVVVEPTFEMYEFYIRKSGGEKVPQLVDDNLEIEAEEVLRRAEGAKAIFICSPNNPTGVQYDADEVVNIAENFSGLVVADEAYVDFADGSLSEAAQNLRNLIVLRTLSKAYGLAGLRIGYLIASEEIVKWVKLVEPPFSVNAVAQCAIEAILEKEEEFKKYILKVREEREYLYTQLEKIDGVRPYKSSANFIMLKVLRNGLSSQDLTKKLLNLGVAVRDRGGLPKIENCIRVTVGSREMNDFFLNALREALREE